MWLCTNNVSLSLSVRMRTYLVVTLLGYPLFLRGILNQLVILSHSILHKISDRSKSSMSCDSHMICFLSNYSSPEQAKRFRSPSSPPQLQDLSRPPLPPPRDASNRMPSPLETGNDTPPPPIPKRIPGQSDRTQNSKPQHRRIQPYRTTDILEDPKPSSSDTSVVRHNFRGEGNIPTEVLRATPTTSKPHPPIKPKPNSLMRPAVPSKPSTSQVNQTPPSPPGSPNNFRNTRAPAVLPKPKPSSQRTLPTMSSLPGATAVAKGDCMSNNSLRHGERGKRAPPLLPPKPRT